MIGYAAAAAALNDGAGAHSVSVAVIYFVTGIFTSASLWLSFSADADCLILLWLSAWRKLEASPAPDHMIAL